MTMTYLSMNSGNFIHVLHRILEYLLLDFLHLRRKYFLIFVFDGSLVVIRNTLLKLIFNLIIAYIEKLS